MDKSKKISDGDIEKIAGGVLYATGKDGNEIEITGIIRAGSGADIDNAGVFLKGKDGALYELTDDAFPGKTKNEIHSMLRGQQDSKDHFTLGSDKINRLT